jgi:hypothetical protein
MDNVEPPPVDSLQDTTALQHTAQGQYLLAEASRVLATSLDYLAGLESLVRLVVPVLADWCVVDMVAEDETVQRLAIAHADPVKEELARQLRSRYTVLRPQATHTILHVIRRACRRIQLEVTEASNPSSCLCLRPLC